MLLDIRKFRTGFRDVRDHRTRELNPHETRLQSQRDRFVPMMVQKLKWKHNLSLDKQNRLGMVPHSPCLENSRAEHEGTHHVRGLRGKARGSQWKSLFRNRFAKIRQI